MIFFSTLKMVDWNEAKFLSAQIRCCGRVYVFWSKLSVETVRPNPIKLCKTITPIFIQSGGASTRSDIPIIFLNFPKLQAFGAYLTDAMAGATLINWICPPFHFDPLHEPVANSWNWEGPMQLASSTDKWTFVDNCDIVMQNLCLMTDQFFPFWNHFYHAGSADIQHVILHAVSIRLLLW